MVEITLAKAGPAVTVRRQIVHNHDTIGRLASPESLVAGGIAALRARYDVELEESVVTSEDVSFNLPRALAIWYLIVAQPGGKPLHTFPGCT
jgi:hypothetical protein